MEVFDYNPNAPWNQSEEENECYYCGEPCERMYCSNDCKNADIL